jgi:helicase MOV-10
VIIFATTRSNTEVDKRKAIGFLQNRRRMNGEWRSWSILTCGQLITHTLLVAITRAQSLLIVVGDPEVLGKDELWRTFLNYACLRKGWTGKPLRWNPKGEVNVPGYKVIKRLSGVVRGECYVGGKNDTIYRFFSRE